MDHSEALSVNPTAGRAERRLSAIIERRLDRRGFIGGVSALAAATALGGCASGTAASRPARKSAAPGVAFEEIARGMDETHHVAADHIADVLIRWGDPLFNDSPAFDPYNQSAAAQRRQFGYNNDFIGLVPLSENRALMCVNHEYTTTTLMLPDVAATYPDSMTRERCDIELAAHGGTIVEIERTGETWRPVAGSRYNRRITADTTPMEMSGPAAGHPRLRTSEDATGRLVSGTMNNCAGGITPWGTYLMAEENFNGCFLGDLPEGHPEAANHARYGVPGGWYQWGRHYDRYDVSKEPHEPNRFGWVVEVDPMDPDSTPKKRTALGRFKHEGAESVVAPDGRLVVYMGDDQRFDYLYKFVSEGRVDTENRAANRDLLDAGTLYVAKFHDDGTLDWMPLVHGRGPLTDANGLDSQAEVLIETRRAADLLGATPMDRPEDVEPDPDTGRVWVMLTNNSRRTEDQVNTANPRAENLFGHIIQIDEPDGDFAATRSRWDFLVKCGDPDVAAIGATWNPLTSENGWFAAPDNCAVDPLGGLWIATDGNQRTGATDGLWAMETDGPARGTGRAFFRVPIGAELCGPRFTQDGETLFVAVQHPGDSDGATFENPGTRWPDFGPRTPPRPAVMAIRKRGGGRVGRA
ncbi:MAG: PhoX family phosphatase [Pseudomonadota bacterium]